MISRGKVLVLKSVLLSMVLDVEGATSLQRWCKPSDATNWVQYNDSLSSCVECGRTTKLISRSSSAESCCSGFFSATCRLCADENTTECNNKNQYCKKHECDGVNDCGDGTDELKSLTQNCSIDCGVGTFECGFPPRIQCFPPKTVCDGSKDCADGFDETNCPYYGGICSGFLCVTLQQCISKSSVCNGLKDCLDGSDEWSCFLRGFDTVFSCNGVDPSGAIIQTNQVCDGTNQCENKLDETNCYFWTPWSTWSSCACDAAKQTRTRKCVAFNALDTHVDGHCNGLLIEGNCDCVISTTLIVIISLVSLIALLGLGCIMYLCWTSKAKKASPNNQDPAAALSRFPTSPAIQSSYHANSIPSVAHTVKDRSPALSSYSQRSHLTPSASRHGASLHDTSPMRSSQALAPPLPARPMSLDGYSSILEVRSMEIDPYAQTKHVKVNSPRPLSKQFSLRRTDSWDSFLTTKDNGAGWETEQRQRTISRFPLEELGKAPTAPHFQRSRSMETLDRDGYLIPTMSQKLKMERKGHYTAMSSPEKGRPFRTTPTKPAGYTKVVKRQNREISTRRRSIKKATSFSHSINKDLATGPTSPTRSETYINILMKQGKYQNIPDAKERLLNYISELEPPLSDTSPARSPPPYSPPRLSVSTASPSHQFLDNPNAAAQDVKVAQAEQYDSLFARNKTKTPSQSEEDYGKLDKEEIDLT